MKRENEEGGLQEANHAEHTLISAANERASRGGRTLANHTAARKRTQVLGSHRAVILCISS
jgi:hypothetical protein